jgi:hypothetical protein
VTKQDSATEILRDPLAKVCLMWKVSRLCIWVPRLTVTKFAEHKWKYLRPQLFEVLMNWADG